MYINDYKYYVIDWQSQHVKGVRQLTGLVVPLCRNLLCHFPLFSEACSHFYPYKRNLSKIHYAIWYYFFRNSQNHNDCYIGHCKVLPNCCQWPPQFCKPPITNTVTRQMKNYQAFLSMRCDTVIWKKHCIATPSKIM